MRANDERLTEQGPERTRRNSEPVRGAERHPSSAEAVLALQRTVGNEATVRLLTAQRMPERGQRPGRRQAAVNSGLSGQPRSARQQEQQGFDPATVRRQELPSRGEAGEPIWSGTRRDIGFTDATVDTMLGNALNQVGTSGRTEYQCAMCNTFIPRKRDATDDDGNRWVTIDHITEIIAYVQAHAEEMEWTVGGRLVHAISREEAKKWANDPNNLRVLCAQPCNGGTRAARSASRNYDTDRAVWWAD